MSAVLGLYNLDGRPVEPGLLGSMLESLAHRGPDGSDVWCEGPIGLGHGMMRITPESQDEKLPLVDREQQTAIVADARLDNRDELCDLLGIRGPTRSEVTDSELLLAAYSRWGEDCVDHLLGDFVFAIWDARQQLLFVTRDLVGTRPFYYHHSPGRFFIFASEVKALLCHPEVPRQFNEVRIADYLAGTDADTVSTFYGGVFRLPPIHCLTVGRGGLRIWEYWQPDLSRELRLRQDSDYLDGFREVFTAAVQCRMRSAYPVGTMLSGGLDSSSIACVMREIRVAGGGPPVPTFSGIYPSLADVNPHIDERRYISAVHGRGHFEPFLIEADRVSPFVDVERMSQLCDEPLPAPNLYLEWAIYEVTRREGIRVLFTGVDGDSVVSHGTEDLRELARRGRWRALAREAAALSRRSRNPQLRTPAKLAWVYGVRPFIPQSLLRAKRRLSGAAPGKLRVGSPMTDLEILNPEFLQRIDWNVRAMAMHDDATAPISAREAHWGGIHSGLFPAVLESFSKIAAPFDLEMTYPFFDRRLVEFCLSLPPGQKLRDGWTRAILRRSMEGILPPEVQWRAGKGMLGSHFKLALLKHERDRLDEAVFGDNGELGTYVNLEVLRSTYERYRADPLNRGSEAWNVYLAVSLDLWLRSEGARMRTDRQRAASLVFSQGISTS